MANSGKSIDKVSPASQSEILRLSEELGYDAHEIKWVVAQNTETIRNLVKVIETISSHSQEISANTVAVRAAQQLSRLAEN